MHSVNDTSYVEMSQMQQPQGGPMNTLPDQVNQAPNYETSLDLGYYPN